MTSSFHARRTRIAALAAQADHAAELLSTLDALLANQEEVRSTLDPSSMNTEAFPLTVFSSLQPVFGDFLDAMRPALTSTLQDAAGILRTQPELWTPLLTQASRQESLEPIAERAKCSQAELTFFGYGFLQPVARQFAETHAARSTTSQRQCPHCEWPPIAAIVRDTTDVKGQLSLVCALCDSAWVYHRAACANCGERSSDKLVVHESETHAHIRIDECESCGAYLKTMDGRKDGRLDALVDDVASVELDLWAREQGMWKLQANVFGL